ncbi:MAG: hypothetical protein AAFO69_09965 [Bacteroidota bacterium]
MMKNSVLIIFLLGSTCMQLQGQPEFEIIDDYLEAIGGNEVLSKVKGMRMTGKLMQQEMEVPFTQVIMNDGRQFSEINIMGLTVKQRVFDGEKMWSVDMSTQEAKYDSDEELRNLRLGFNDFPDVFYNYKNKGYSFKYIGKEKMGERETYKLEVRKEDLMVNGKQMPDVVYYFIDVEDKLSIAQQTITTDESGNEILVTILFNDYMDVGNGYLTPKSLSQYIGEQLSFELVITDIELNPVLDDSEFTFPGN